MIDVMNNNRQSAFIGCPNEKGFLSTFKVKLNALSLSDVEQKRVFQIQIYKLTSALCMTKNKSV